MNVLVLGSGGREHALSWMIAKSKLCNDLYIAPGNSGTAQVGKNVNLNPKDFEAVADFSLQNKIDLIVVGPEDPIVAGIADFFEGNEKYEDISVLAPSAAAAKLEGSKEFAKEFMQRHQIPTAAYKSFGKNDRDLARKYILEQGAPIVIKADGLAAGKGVTVAFDTETALQAVDDCFLKEQFGDAGSRLVIEQYLDGIELSVFVLTDGEHYVMLPEAKDYKRIGENDQGPNTGGMGAVSPVPFANKEFMNKVVSKVVEPTIQGLKKDGLTYRGFVFFGLMNVNGEPYVIEYNVRLGDPETEAILPRINNDLLVLMFKAAQGELFVEEMSFVADASVTVVLVSEGYPGKYEKHKEIRQIVNDDKTVVFHAGAKTENGKIYSNGGRVLAVSSLGKSLPEAQQKSMQVAEQITFENKFYRKDIAEDLKKYLQQD